ncbi:MAG: acetoin utilization deacetylase AcuC-like enzyme [Myxococcota bacterium]|jgi:acetoin utilization deacetylase AcuC-like enzyme
MSQTPAVPVFFHTEQLAFKPLYEWAFGEKIDHPETTARAESILAAVEAEGPRFVIRQPSEVPLGALRQQHAMNLLTLYQAAEAQLEDDQTFYPMVFPREHSADPTNLHHAGAFCFDSGTPLAAQTLRAAGWSAACGKAAAVAVRKEGCKLAYALSRPPGHHATRGLFGGYCYFNNAGVAARHLKRSGRVVVLDIDYHHGNGTQSLFWRDDKVFTISVHGDPRDVFPFFAGFAPETGGGRGQGYNLNIPLPRGLDGAAYFDVFDATVLPAIRTFAPDYLVVAAGFDTYKLDPVGHWAFETADYHELGGRLARLDVPTVAVQEGGYYTPHLGANAVAFLRGFDDVARSPYSADKPRHTDE